MRSTWLVLPFACALATIVAAQDRAASPARPPLEAPADDQPPPVEIRTSVSRTAVWLGDRVTYAIELRCAPQVDIVTDDLAAEQLKVEGLEIRDVAIDRDASLADRLTYRVRYSLVTYRIDATALSIAAFPVRYSIRRPGQRPEDPAPPAGEVRVPPLALSLRSTIPDKATALAIRDGRGAQPLSSRVYLAQPVGLGLLMLAVFPVALWGADLVRRAWRSRAHDVRRLTRKQRRASLEEIKALDVSTVTAQRDAYSQLDAWIRDHARHATGIAAAALTPSEIPLAVPRPPRALRIDQLQTLLVECERAKYAPEPPNADRWPDVLQEAEQLLVAEAR